MLIRSVDVWHHKRLEKNVDIWIDEHNIIHNGSNAPNAAQELKHDGLVLMPAGVDPQVHLRVPGQPEKEHPGKALQAAREGGIHALLTMPNTKPVIDSTETLDQAARELEPFSQQTGVEVFLSAAITRGQRGKEAVDFKLLAKHPRIKAFTDDGLGVQSDEIMHLAFAASADTGLPILQHAECSPHPGVIASGPIQQKLNTPAYPEEAEWQMVERDLKILKDYPEATYHVLHVSARKTVELVCEAKSQGLKASCEVSPHHLYFGSEDIDESNTAFKMNPPLRDQAQRRFLREALADGRIDFVATDHAPHEISAKSQGLLQSAYGTTGLETSLYVLLKLYAEGLISPERLVNVFSHRPSHFLQLDEAYGHIRYGLPCHWILLNPKTDRTIDNSRLLSLNHNNCFLGQVLKGEIIKSSALDSAKIRS
jgi:dihydroorotase